MYTIKQCKILHMQKMIFQVGVKMFLKKIFFKAADFDKMQHDLHKCTSYLGVHDHKPRV